MKGLLHAIKQAVDRDSLDGDNRAAIYSEGERETTRRRQAINQDGARAANTLIARGLGAAQLQRFTQQIDQQHIDRNVEDVASAVDRQADCDRVAHVGACAMRVIARRSMTCATWRQ